MVGWRLVLDSDERRKQNGHEPRGCQVPTKDELESMEVVVNMLEGKVASEVTVCALE